MTLRRCLAGAIVLASGALVYVLFRPPGVLLLPDAWALGLRAPAWLEPITGWWPTCAHALGLGLLSAGLAGGRLATWTLSWAAIGVAFEGLQHPALASAWQAWCVAGWPAWPADFALNGTHCVADVRAALLAFVVACLLDARVTASAHRRTCSSAFAPHVTRSLGALGIVATVLALPTSALAQSTELFGTYFLEVGNRTSPVNFVSETNELTIEGPGGAPLVLAATAADPRHDSDVDIFVDYGTIGVRATALPTAGPVDIFVDSFGQFVDTFTINPNPPVAGLLTGTITMNFTGSIVGSGFGSASLRFSNGISSQMVRIVQGDPLPGPVTFTYFTTAGVTNELTFVGEVTAQLSAGAPASMSSDFLNTFEWVGMTVTDSGGNDLDFTLQSGSGTLYPVPEPSLPVLTWFALVALLVTRRLGREVRSAPSVH